MGDFAASKAQCVAQYWQLVFREIPSFDDGFVVWLTAFPEEECCRYEVKRASTWDLDHELPLIASGEVPRAEPDVIFGALSRATLAAVPPHGHGFLDGVSYGLSVDAGAMYGCLVS